MNTEIIARFLDDRDSLSRSELEALANWLRETPGAADRLFAMLTVDDLLGRAISVDRADFAEQVRQRLADLKGCAPGSAFESGVLKRVAGGKPGRRFAVLFPALAAAAGVMLLAGLWLSGPDRVSVTGMARIESVQGDVRLVAEDGEHVVAEPGMALVAGTWLETGKDARASLAMTDGESVRVWPESRLRAGADVAGVADRQTSGLHLAAGRISAAVPKRSRGDRMVFSTPHALARIVGTAFELEAQPKFSRLDVQEGTVEWTPQGRDRTFAVGPGQSATAGRDGHAAMLGEPVWVEDFSQGLNHWKPFGETEGMVSEDELARRVRIVGSGRRDADKEKALELDARGLSDYVNIVLQVPVTNRMFVVFFDYEALEVQAEAGFDVICLSPETGTLETLFRGGPGLPVGRRTLAARYESGSLENEAGEIVLYERRYWVGEALGYWGKRTYRAPAKSKFLRLSVRHARIRVANIRIVPILETTVPLDGKASLLTGR